MDAKETRLYWPIEDLMETRGYAVIPQFKMFSPLTCVARKLDLLGFRWTDDGNLDAWAIEAKQGALPAHALAALGQAIEYQLYVPRVSVAAEVRREGLAFAEEPLRKLGLGYIHATPKLATEIIPPAPSSRCFQNEANYVIRHAGVLCLLGRERWKKQGYRENHSGRRKTTDAARYSSYGIHNKDPAQYQLSARGRVKKVQLDIWIQRKRVLARIYKKFCDKVERGHLAKLLANSGATATISKYEMDHFRRLGDPKGKPHLLTDETSVAKAVYCALNWLTEPRVISAISVALELWAWDAMPRRAEAEKELALAIERLEPIREYLAEMAK
jgi:hypothetical protein